jgi:hypothetical protein
VDDHPEEPVVVWKGHQPPGSATDRHVDRFDARDGTTSRREPIPGRPAVRVRGIDVFGDGRDGLALGRSIVWQSLVSAETARESGECGNAAR